MTELKEVERVKTIDAYVHHDHNIGVLVEYICDTTLPGRDKHFQVHVRQTAMHIASANPSNMSELLEQVAVSDTDKKVGEVLSELAERFNEKIEIHRFLRWDTEYNEGHEPPSKAPAAVLRAVK